jgi:hypothetical protein
MSKHTMLLPLALLAAACNGNSDKTPPDTTPDQPDPCEVSGNICTWLGSTENRGIPDDDHHAAAGVSEDGLDRLDTWLYLPVDITFTADGTAYYPDYNNHRIRKVNPDGGVHTLSGTAQLGDGPNVLGSTTNCWGGCDALDSAWNHPTDVIVDPDNPTDLYVAAWHNSRVNVIDWSMNTMYWDVGSGGRNYVSPVLDDVDGDGFADGDVDKDGTTLDEVTLDLPSSLAFAEDGSLYIADQANHVIRRLTPDGIVELVAGQPRHAGYGGDGGPASDSYLHGHTDQKADPGSKILIHDNVLYMVDTVNGVIRSIDLDTMVIDHVAGKYESLGTTTYTDAITGVSYEADAGSVPGYADGNADTAIFTAPRDIAIGIDGELYVAEPSINCVRRIDPDGTVTTFAGQCDAAAGWGGEGGPATDAQFNLPFGVATDAEGNVYIADSNNQVIRRVKH